jgi:Mor family transcriptional regulator
LRWKKLPCANSAAGSFDPFMRQECDRRNQEIYALHQQVVTVRELAKRFGLSEKRAWVICTAERKHDQEHLPPKKTDK